MNKLSRLRLLLLPFLLCLPARPQTSGNYAAVDPMIGTAGGGNTFPGASVPFGMIQWSPDTTTNGFYRYKDKKIYGFSLTHLSGVGCPIYADVPVLPWTGELQASPGTDRTAYVQAFSHDGEQAHPGYYAVTLANGIKVELTVTDRAGIARFTFPEGSPARLLVNTGGSANTDVHMAILPPVGREHDGNQVEVIGNNALGGSVTSGGFCGTPTRYTLYVAAKFEQPFQKFATWQDGAIHKDERKAVGKHTGAWLDFGSQPEVAMKIGLSYVSEANARENLDKEISGLNFEQTHAQARQRWTNLLNRVAVEGGTADQRRIFYTGLYHSLLCPTLFSDDNGDYMGFERKQHTVAGSAQKAQYANYSDWDIYRNTVQLQSLLVARREGDMMQSLVNDATQSGWLPRWPAANDVTYVMGGDSSPILLASAYAFGARNFDTKAALHFMLKAATQPGKGQHNTAERPFLADYLKLGYVPAGEDGISASRTLEYANSDFAIAQFAKNLGDMADYRRLLQQSQNWKNLLDPATRWIRPRNADGTWLAGFDAERSLPKRKNAPLSTDQDGFEEGNTYQYSFMLPFDYPGLFSGMGGDAKVTPRLDKFFSKLICWGEPCFNMANEPDFVTPYAYEFAGMPWKTQQVVTRIEQQTFNTAPDGIPGNDDLGATSGVYVWNALGMYPAVPGVGGMLLGTPMFRKAVLHLADGRTVTISATGTGPYVQSVTLNGAAYSNSWLPLSALPAGESRLVFTLDTKPNEDRGKPDSERPPSFLQR